SFFFFSSRRRHTRSKRDWSSDVCSSDLFDGLDPVMRQAVKGLFAADVAERELTPIIASHNLRELEDICDHVGLLHKGGILLSREIGRASVEGKRVEGGGGSVVVEVSVGG